MQPSQRVETIEQLSAQLEEAFSEATISLKKLSKLQGRLVQRLREVDGEAKKTMDLVDRLLETDCECEINPDDQRLINQANQNCQDVAGEYNLLRATSISKGLTNLTPVMRQFETDGEIGESTLLNLTENGCYLFIVNNRIIGLKNLVFQANQLVEKLKNYPNPSSFKNAEEQDLVSLVNALNKLAERRTAYLKETASTRTPILKKKGASSDPAKREEPIIVPLSKILQEIESNIQEPVRVDEQLVKAGLPAPSQSPEAEKGVVSFTQKFVMLKEKCQTLWNQFLLKFLVCDLKVLLINDCIHHEDKLKRLCVRVGILEKDLREARHIYKSKQDPVPNGGLSEAQKKQREADAKAKGDQGELRGRFNLCVQEFKACLEEWKESKTNLENALESYSNQELQYHKWTEDALPKNDTLFTIQLLNLVNGDVRRWLTPVRDKFDTGLFELKICFKEIAFWMDVTDCVLKNPSWTYFGRYMIPGYLFPLRTFFEQNPKGDYTSYVTYRNLVKGVVGGTEPGSGKKQTS